MNNGMTSAPLLALGPIRERLPGAPVALLEVMAPALPATEVPGSDFCCETSKILVTAARQQSNTCRAATAQGSALPRERVFQLRVQYDAQPEAESRS